VKANIGFAMCGSFCTFSKAISQIKNLKKLDYNVIPIMSETAFSTDTRFGFAVDFINKIEKITGNKIISSICGAEPAGPEKMFDLLIVAPCTGNTLAKLAGGITDTAVTMAVKSHLRICRPVLVCAATNDALGASALNIGRLLNTKHFYFVPMSQDDTINKPKSLVGDFELIPECAEAALNGEQIQPVFKTFIKN
jgi:dipicolinate synthase subunit B